MRFYFIFAVMYLRAVTVLIVMIMVACQPESGARKDLDPFLVSIAGENYQDIILERPEPLPSDSIEILEITIDSFIFDLTEDKKRLSHEFNFYNSGTEVSTIIDYFSYCKCVYPMGQIIFVNPGESAQLNVTFDPRAWKAGETKNIYVRTTHFPHLYTLSIKRKYEL